MAKKTKLSPKLIKYLESLGIKHEIIEHKTVYTAFDAAATLKRKLNEIAKALLIKADKDYYIVVLSADNNLDFEKLNKIISKEFGKKVKTIKIPGEKIMENTLKIKAGTMSAFGGVHKLPVIVDKKLEKIKKVIFSAGSYNHSLELAVKDFIKAENALLGSFGVKRKVKKQKTTPAKKIAKKSSTTKSKKSITTKKKTKTIRKKK